MRIFAILAFVAAAFVLTPVAAAQTVATNVVRTADPRLFVSDISDRMSRTGMAPLRRAYEQLFNSNALPTDIESALLAFEREIGEHPAEVHRVVEDVVLADTLRSIYTYHYYGRQAWLFVRYDFVRVGNSDWAVSAISMSSQWGYVSRTTTPGFQSVP